MLVDLRNFHPSTKALSLQPLAPWHLEAASEDHFSRIQLIQCNLGFHRGWLRGTTSPTWGFRMPRCRFFRRIVEGSGLQGKAISWGAFCTGMRDTLGSYHQIRKPVRNLTASQYLVKQWECFEQRHLWNFLMYFESSVAATPIPELGVGATEMETVKMQVFEYEIVIFLGKNSNVKSRF